MGVCAAFFLCGLPFCYEGGIYLFTLFDTRLASSLLVITALEMLMVGWFYREVQQDLTHDIEVFYVLFERCHTKIE